MDEAGGIFEGGREGEKVFVGVRDWDDLGGRWSLSVLTKLLRRTTWGIE